MKNTDPDFTLSTIALALTSAVLIVVNPPPPAPTPVQTPHAAAATATTVEGRKEPTMNARQPVDTTTERIVSLHTEELFRMNGSARLRVARGMVWLTLDGRPDDHVLLPGDRFTLDHGDHALLQALRAPAVVAVAEAAPAWPARAARALLFAHRRAALAL